MCSRRKIITFLLILSCLFLISCEHKNNSMEPVTPTGSMPSEMPSQIPSEIAKQDITPTPTKEPVIKNTDPKHIRWASNTFWPSTITEEAQNRINQILKEKGIDCTLEFVMNRSQFHNEEYVEWIAEEDVDIFDLGYWDSPLWCMEFAKEAVLPLDEYLLSDAGKVLRDSYSEAEWKQMSPNGSVLAVPVWSVPGYYNGAFYIALDSQYSSYFSDFDGTYSSLKEIASEVGNPNLKIVISGVDNNVIAALLGYENSYYASIPYDPKTKRLVEPSRFVTEATGLIGVIYADLKSGFLVNRQYDSQEVGRPFAYIYQGIRSMPDGYAIYCIARDLHECNMNCGYAVSKTTRRKELALQVFSVCLSDPEIVSIINWGADYANAEKWKEKTKLLVSEGVTELAGFFPNLSEEEKKNLGGYSNTLHEALRKLYFYSSATDDYSLNPDFKPDYPKPEQVSKVYEKGINAWNREAEKWIKEN